MKSRRIWSRCACCNIHYTTSLNSRQLRWLGKQLSLEKSRSEKGIVDWPCLSPKQQSGKPFPDRHCFADRLFDGYGQPFPTDVFFPDRHLFTNEHFMPTDSQPTSLCRQTFQQHCHVPFSTNYPTYYLLPTSFHPHGIFTYLIYFDRQKFTYFTQQSRHAYLKTTKK